MSHVCTYRQTVQQQHGSIFFSRSTDFAGQRGRGDLACSTLCCCSACLYYSPPPFLSFFLSSSPPLPLSTLIEIIIYLLSFSSLVYISHLAVSFRLCPPLSPPFSRCHNLVRGLSAFCSHIPEKFILEVYLFCYPTTTHTTRLLW